MNISTLRRTQPLPWAQSQHATCCPLSVHRGPRGPTLTSSTTNGLARLEASSTTLPPCPPYPPTICVLDGDLEGVLNNEWDK